MANEANASPSQSDSARKITEAGVDHFRLADIYLLESESRMTRDSHPSQLQNNLTFQYRIIQDDTCQKIEDDKGIVIWRFFNTFEARFIKKNIQEETEGAVIASIRAMFVSEYNQVKDADENLARMFGNMHAIYHAWPYWREFLQNMCSRHRLPNVMLPMLIVNVQQEAKS